MRFLPPIIWLLLLAPAANLANLWGQARGDSVQVAADTTRVSTSPDTAVVADSSRAIQGDPAFSWKSWADISRAIALRPLDGPEDILEKREIIEDRLDDLLIECFTQFGAFFQQPAPPVPLS